MIHKPRVYLDTTVPSAVLDARSIDRQEETAEFWGLCRTKYEPCISQVVIDEILRTKQAKRRHELESLVADLPVLTISLASLELARNYVERGIFPERYMDDARHLAIAVSHGIPIIASWNFRHLVKLKTQHLVSAINVELGLGNIEIVTPAQL